MMYMAAGFADRLAKPACHALPFCHMNAHVVFIWVTYNMLSKNTKSILKIHYFLYMKKLLDNKVIVVYQSKLNNKANKTI